MEAVGFYNPVDILGPGNGWVVQRCTPVAQQDRAGEPGADGDEAATKSYNGRTSLTQVYKNFAAAGNLTLPKVGSVLNGYHVDSVKIVKGLLWPEMTVTAHKHDVATHVDAIPRRYSAVSNIPAGWGVPMSISGIYELANLEMSVKAFSYSLSANHVDELGGDGNWKAGDNRDGVETVEIEVLGNAGADLVIAAGWHAVTNGPDASNTASENQKANLERHVTKDA